MKHSFLQLVDLPDELLLMIFKNLENVLALYSFMGINRRFDQILHDPIFTNRLTLMTCSRYSCFYPMCSEIIDRFYFNISPEIHHEIQWLNLEASSMERLLATNYPKLSGLGLYNIKEETIEQHFTGNKTQLFVYS